MSEMGIESATDKGVEGVPDQTWEGQWVPAPDQMYDADNRPLPGNPIP